MVASVEDDAAEVPEVPGEDGCGAGVSHGHDGQVGEVYAGVGVLLAEVECQFEFWFCWCVVMDAEISVSISAPGFSTQSVPRNCAPRGKSPQTSLPESLRHLDELKARYSQLRISSYHLCETDEPVQRHRDSRQRYANGWGTPIGQHGRA